MSSSASPRLTLRDRATRRDRVFARLLEGQSVDAVAAEEGVTPRRVRQMAQRDRHCDGRLQPRGGAHRRRIGAAETHHHAERRGVGALGYTIQRPSEDRYLMTREELENRIAVLLGGWAVEWLVFGHLSTGASDDLAKVTDIACDMIMRYGMDETLGPVSYESPRSPFLAGPMQPEGWSEQRYSDATARLIDEAVRRVVEQTFDRALSILKSRRDLLEQGAKLLLQKETLEDVDLRDIDRKLKRAAHEHAA